MFFRMLEDTYVTSVVERSKNPPWGLEGGGQGRPNSAALRYPDGTRKEFSKTTRLLAPTGSTFELRTGGGGGYGSPAERDPEQVARDIAEGYVTRAHAEHRYR
jgi:N-methylhydantoinase B